jgi:hypothetical protein
MESLADQLLNKIDEVLDESYYNSFKNENGEFFEVFKNPTKKEFFECVGGYSARGYIDLDGNLYIINAYSSTHERFTKIIPSLYAKDVSIYFQCIKLLKGVLIEIYKNFKVILSSYYLDIFFTRKENIDAINNMIDKCKEKNSYLIFPTYKVNNENFSPENQYDYILNRRLPMKTKKNMCEKLNDDLNEVIGNDSSNDGLTELNEMAINTACINYFQDPNNIDFSDPDEVKSKFDIIKDENKKKAKKDKWDSFVKALRDAINSWRNYDNNDNIIDLFNGEVTDGCWKYWWNSQPNSIKNKITRFIERLNNDNWLEKLKTQKPIK